MKDHVQSCHLTKFDVFKINRDQVIDLETWLKSIQMSVILRQCPQKPPVASSFLLAYILEFAADSYRIPQALRYIDIICVKPSDILNV